MILIPILKMFESGIYSKYFELCPWDHTDMRNQRKMNAISLYTFVNILLIFLSRGWFTRTYSLSTCKIVKYGFFMLILDWFQSQQFDAIDKPKNQKMVEFILTFVYFIVFCSNFWSIYG